MEYKTSAYGIYMEYMFILENPIKDGLCECELLKRREEIQLTKPKTVGWLAVSAISDFPS